MILTIVVIIILLTIFLGPTTIKVVQMHIENKKLQKEQEENKKREEIRKKGRKSLLQD